MGLWYENDSHTRNIARVYWLEEYQFLSPVRQQQTCVVSEDVPSVAEESLTGNMNMEQVYQRQYAQHRLCCHLNDS